MSQSLFYWNPFCNTTQTELFNKWIIVAILILLESFLQYEMNEEFFSEIIGRNPYFIGILSAIKLKGERMKMRNWSQSLFYWNPFCNKNWDGSRRWGLGVAILILLESFLQYKKTLKIKELKIKSQSLFYWNPFCNTKHNRSIQTQKKVAILILLESFLQWKYR